MSDPHDHLDDPLTEAQKAELDRRLDEEAQDPSAGIPWSEVLERIRSRES